MVNLVAHPGDVVLVTGGCGFVGRSLIKLLLEKSDNLAEVIILDIRMPPEDLVDLISDHQLNSPKVRFIQCDIRDARELSEAFEGVDVVLHLASLLDTSRTADMKRSHDINVTGTKNVVEACRKNNVEYLVSTSTTEINRGYSARTDATERAVNEEDRAIADLVMPGYSSSKRLGEEIVLAANGKALPNGKRMHTVALRPPGIYGENDVTYVTQVLRTGKCFFGIVPILGAVETKMQRVYVGNVAWAHVHSVNTMRNDASVCGQAYNIVDGSSAANNFLWMKPILETQHVKVLPIAIPLVLVYYFYFLLELFLWILSPLLTVKLPAERNHLYLCCTSVTYNGNLAKQKLGYKPLYSSKEAYTRSLEYYSNIKV